MSQVHLYLDVPRQEICLVKEAVTGKGQRSRRQEDEVVLLLLCHGVLPFPGFRSSRKGKISKTLREVLQMLT